MERRGAWGQDPADLGEKAAGNIGRLAICLELIAAQYPSHARALLEAQNSARMMERVLLQDNVAWRRHRPLLLVHLPVILNAFGRLDCDLIPENTKNALLGEICAVLDVLQDACRREGERRATDIRLDVQTSGEMLGAGPAAATGAQEAVRGHGAGLGAGLTRFGGLARRTVVRGVEALPGAGAAIETTMSVASIASNAAQSGAEHAVRMVSEGGAAMLDTAGDMAGRAALAARIATAGTIDAVADALGDATAPVRAHGSALVSTAVSGGIVAAGLGAASAIVFPPIIPVAIGIGFLTGFGHYDEFLGRASEMDLVRREAARRERRGKMAERMAKLRGKAECVQIDTGHVRIIVEVASGACDGIILSGSYAGRRLSGMTGVQLRDLARDAPDQASKDALTGWLSVNLPDFGKDAADGAGNQPDDGSTLFLGFTLGVEALAGLASLN